MSRKRKPLTLADLPCAKYAQGPLDEWPWTMTLEEADKSFAKLNRAAGTELLALAYKPQHSTAVSTTDKSDPK